MKIKYMDRETQKLEEEKVFGSKYLNWLYESPVGMGLVEKVFKKQFFSRLYGRLQDTPQSRTKINDFIKEFAIDMKDYKRQAHEYTSFNDFFYRELKEGARPIEKDGQRLISPADGRLLAYQSIDYQQVLQVKGSTFSLEGLLGDKELAKAYDKGSYIIVRLCPTDYHRFHFPDEGVPEKTQEVRGYYYSVNPVALFKKPEIYCLNKRTLTIFHSKHFDDILYIEVGASCVGTIVQTYQHQKPVAKGEEKGYFKFGGSTVIIILKPGIIEVDRDLLENTQQGLETKVKMGTGIGIAKTKTVAEV